MQMPVQISFRHMDPTPWIEEKIREKAARLERSFDRITRCDVVVEAPHHDHRKGRLYHVRIDMTVPGGKLAVRGDGPHASEDVRVAIRDAFDAARRQLDDWIARKRDVAAVEAVEALAAE